MDFENIKLKKIKANNLYLKVSRNVKFYATSCIPNNFHFEFELMDHHKLQK